MRNFPRLRSEVTLTEHRLEKRPFVVRVFQESERPVKQRRFTIKANAQKAASELATSAGVRFVDYTLTSEQAYSEVRRRLNT